MSTIKARKKPVEVDVIEFTGWNWADCEEFMGDNESLFPQEIEYKEKLERGSNGCTCRGLYRKGSSG